MRIIAIAFGCFIGSSCLGKTFTAILYFLSSLFSLSDNLTTSFIYKSSLLSVYMDPSICLATLLSLVNVKADEIE